jgi:hypothetical protein
VLITHRFIGRASVPGNVTHSVALVAYEGFWHAWVLDLPGCATGVDDLDALDGALRLSIAEYGAWLRQHGDPDAGDARATDDGGGWEIVERLDARDFAATGGEYLFDADRASLDDGELAVLLRQMAHARDDLTAAVAHLPAAILEWEPPATAIGQADPWAPEPRTIGGIVEHVLQLEVYYRDSLRDGPAKGIFERVGEAEAERRTTVDALNSLPAAERARVWRPVHPSRTAEEEWTVRKCVRRIIAHERAHAAEIWQRRSWVLLGAPVLHRA